MIERSQNLELEDSNQSSEGVFKNTKHNLSIEDNLSEVGVYVSRRWEDMKTETKLLVKQLDDANTSKIRSTPPDADREAQGASSSTSPRTQETDLTRDLAESNENTGWGKRPTQENARDQLRKELKAWNVHMGKELKSTSAKFKALVATVGEDKLNVSESAFSSLVNGKNSAPRTVNNIRIAFDAAKQAQRAKIEGETGELP